MSRELWEKVDPRTLRPGDVVVNYAGEKVVWDAGDSQIISDNPAGPWHLPCLFRRVPDDEDPRVLRRALDLMERLWLQGIGLRNPKCYIEKARKEFESEGSDDQA